MPLFFAPMPAGMVFDYAGASNPFIPDNRFHLCNGQAVARNTDLLLYSVLTNQSPAAGRTNANAIITGLVNTTGLSVGDQVEGTGIPAGAAILTVDSTTQITMNMNAGSTGSGLVTIFPWGNGDGSTTFNVPNYEGRTGVGRNSANANVSTIGANDGIVAATRSPLHNHGPGSLSGTTGAPSSTVAATILVGGAASTTHTHTVSVSGGSTATQFGCPFNVVSKVITRGGV